MQVELTQPVVVLGHLTLALKYLDEHTGLIVSICRENLFLSRRDGGVSGDKRRHNTTSGFYSEGQRSHV